MDEQIETLKAIGVSAEDCDRAKRHFKDDPDGMRNYVLIMRAMLDDRHEYLD